MTWDIFVKPEIIEEAERANNNLLTPPPSARITNPDDPKKRGAEWWESFKIINTNAGPYQMDDGRTLATYDITAQVDSASSTDLTNSGRILNLRYFIHQEALNDKNHPAHRMNSRSYATISSLLKAANIENSGSQGLSTFFVGDEKPLLGGVFTGKVREYTDKKGVLRQTVEKWLPS